MNYSLNQLIVIPLLKIQRHKMKKIFVALLLIIGTINSYSQVLEPVKWTTAVEKISDTEYQLVSKAIIDSGWHLYCHF